MPTHYGHLARMLHACAEKTVTAALAQMDLTAAQGHVLGYITHRPDPPCARDVEEAFQLSHPTVSGILSRLEQKDFIELRADPTDRRCKRIYIRPKGWELDEMMHNIIRSTEEKMVEGFTPQEQAQFAELLHRAIGNLGGNPCKRKHKEEPPK